MGNKRTSEEIFNLLTDNGRNIRIYEDKHSHQEMPPNDFILMSGALEENEKLPYRTLKSDVRLPHKARGWFLWI